MSDKDFHRQLDLLLRNYARTSGVVVKRIDVEWTLARILSGGHELVDVQTSIEADLREVF